jgi:thioredoxin-dependent peroxiredoxin
VFVTFALGVSMAVVSRLTAPLVSALAVAAVAASAQQPATPHPGDSTFAPKVGQAAPDFTLPGATRFGVLKEPVRLAEYRGQIVVLAFFPKARTKG